MPRKRKRRRFKNGTSKIETRICKALGGEKFKYKNKEFDIALTVDDKLHVIEIDGDYFHPTVLKNLNILQIGNYLNDRKKDLLIKEVDCNFYRIKTSVLKKKRKIDLAFIKKNQYIPQSILKEDDVILTSKYLQLTKTEYLITHVDKVVNLFLLTLSNVNAKEIKEKLIKIFTENKNLDISYQTLKSNI